MKPKDFSQLQLDDKSLKTFFKKTAELGNIYPKFVLQNGILVRIANSSKNRNDLLQQILVPKQLREDIMCVGHEILLAGHLGITKTQSRILNHFYWPGIYADVRRFCNSCEVCQKMSNMKPAKVPLVNLPVISEPFQRVAIDIIGPLTKSLKGNRFALVFIDMATKYPDAVPLKRIDSGTVAEALMDIYSRVGLPREVLHDCGSNFISAVMKRFNELLRIKSIHTTPYNPRCNGLVEGFNKTLKQMIRKVVADEPQYWDKFIQPLLFAYREVPQCSTGFSPFELLYGHSVRGPLFLLKDKILDESKDPDLVPITTYVMNMRNKIRECLEISEKNEKFSKSREKTYYDRSARKRKFNVGEKVLLLLPTSNNKLLSEWRGPYEVVRRINDVDYLIRIGEKERCYHINMLKKYRERKVLENENLVIEEVNVVEGYNINVKLDDIDQDSMRTVIEKNSEIFSKIPGKIAGIEYDIKVDPGIKPISSSPYRLPFNLKDKVKSELDNWLKMGIIRESNSPWASPMVVVRNKDESIRLTIDFRKLNFHITSDNYPMPLRENVIENLHNSSYLTKLDLTKAYLQIPLTENSKQFTSFVNEYGQFEFQVVPFGIKFASGLCNRIIKSILKDCQPFVTSFIDDLMIHSQTYEEHLEHVDIVLTKLNEAGITLNLKKCHFAQSEVKFLGVQVGNGKVSPDPEKVVSIRNFKRPTDKKSLRSYLGLLSFYRKFIPNLAVHTYPLSNLLKKGNPDIISWTADLTEIFEKSINLISENAMLSMPKPGYEFVVQTDASAGGIGAVLGQLVKKEFVPIAFISRVLNSAEGNYSVIEKECLAIKWAVNYFHEYLYGAKFTVCTDHAPLSWLHKNKDKNSRLMRWALSLQSYDFVIKYIKGSENFMADFMSRIPVVSP